MRNINAAVQAAINNTNGLKANARLKIFNNRAFFESADLDISHAIGFPQAAGIFEDTAIFQDCKFDLSLSKVVTVVKSTVGYQLGIEGTSSGNDITNTSALKTRPTIVPPYIYYQNTDGSLARDTYSYTDPTFTITGTEVISSEANKAGSLYGIDASNAIHIYIDDGGVGITHWKLVEGVWTPNVWSGRIMFPNEIWTSSHLVRLNFATAAKTDKGIFVYLSSPNGEVIGIQLLPNGNWSDTFTAFPQDLSKFYISNSIVDAYQRIHLCGQFTRTDNWNSGTIYNLSLWSDDGITFSVDRFTLVSTLGYRFMVSLGRNKVLFSDMNRIAEVEPCFTFYREDATSLEITEGITFSGTVTNGWDITIGNGNNKYTDSPLIKTGNVAKLEIGISSGGTFAWQEYDNTIISKVQEVFANGTRSLEIKIVSEGLWKAMSATYPFGMEIQSKQSIRDDVSAMDNLSTAPNTHGIRDPFCVALSTVEAPFGVNGKPAGTNYIDWYSGDLISVFSLEEYPDISEFPLTIKLFGWSRIGLWDQNPNVPDDTDVSLLNDTFTPCFVVENADGEERTVVIDNSYAVDGINYPPQTWKPGNSRATTGTYPVVFYVDAECGLAVGDKIKQVGIRVFSEAPTVYYLERIEIPELPMYMIGTYYGGTLGEETDWGEIYIPTPYVPPELPPITFPPIVFPTPTPTPVTPPNIESCGSDPVSAVTITHTSFSLIGNTLTGSQTVWPFVCRLRASTNTNPSKITIEGRFEEEETAYVGSFLSSKFIHTDRTDFYLVEALNYDHVVVATAHLTDVSPALYPLNANQGMERRTGIFDNTEEVDICFIRISVSKTEYSAGTFTVSEDPYSDPAVPFRPTSVVRPVNEGRTYIGWYAGGQFANPGTLTWGFSPGGIWIKNTNIESLMGEGNTILGWRPSLYLRWRITGGNTSQYINHVFNITVKQKKFATNGGTYSNRDYIYDAANYPGFTNPYSQGATGIAWQKYVWLLGNAGNKPLMYEPNHNQEFSGSSSTYGTGDTEKLDICRYLHLQNSDSSSPQVYANSNCHIGDHEVYIKVKYPGFEHEGHSNAPTKLTVAYAAMENACGME